MHRRAIFTPALLALVLALPAWARAADEQTKGDKPGVILRVASLDHLRADFRYLAEVVGQGEKAKQLDELIKAKLGDKGLEGIDTKRPMGLYGWIGGFGIDSKAVVLIPIADKKAFLELLSDALDTKPEKGDDDVYSCKVDKVPDTVYFRFASNYVYATVRDKDVLEKNKLLAPEIVSPASNQSDTFSLTANIDQIPNNLKELALGSIENQLANGKDQEVPHQTEAQKKLRDATIDEIGATIKSLFNQGGETTLRVDLDRAKGDLALTVSVAGKPGSSMAKTIQQMGEVKSYTASLLHKNSAFRAELNASLPEKLRSLLTPALQDGEKQALAHTKDANQRQVLTTILEGVMPTLQSAELDTAIDLRGPGTKGIYTVLGGIKIKDRPQLEKSFRKMAERYPALLKLDVEKVGDATVHRINPDKNVTANAKNILGENPIYLTFRDEVLLFGAGEKGLDALKEALALAPTTGKVLELQMSFARLAPLMDDPKQAEIARKLFQDDKENDRVRLTLEGGKALTLRLALKAKLIQFVNEIDKAKKNAD